MIENKQYNKLLKTRLGGTPKFIDTRINETILSNLFMKKGTEMIERELINKIPGAVDFSEPQTGRKVNEFSYCPKFEQRRTSSVPHRDCFFLQVRRF